MMKRYLCRHVIADGVDMGLCVVTITPMGEVSITPFESETSATIYLDGILEVSTDGHTLRAIFHNGKPLVISHGYSSIISK